MENNKQKNKLEYEQRKETKIAFVGFVILVMLIIGAMIFVDVAKSNSAAYADDVKVDQSGDKSLNETISDLCPDLQFDSVLVKNVDLDKTTTYKYYMMKYRDSNSLKEINAGDMMIMTTDLYDYSPFKKEVENYEYQDTKLINDEIINFLYKSKEQPKNTDEKPQNQQTLKERSVEELILTDNGSLGNYGRMYIPKQNVSFKIYDTLYSDNENSLFQQYANREESSSIAQYGAEKVCTSLILQKNPIMSKLFEGDVIYIKRPNNVLEKYVCSGGGYGNVQHNELYYYNKCLTGMNGEGLALYNYLDTSKDRINIRFFHRV